MSRLDAVGRAVLRGRYLQRDATGRVVETPDELFRRVADAVARPEAAYGGDVAEIAARFESAMRTLRFLPNSPTLMNAGTELDQLAACFVLPIADSLDAIFGTLHDTALVHQSGGGTGFSFSALRPAGDVVQETGGVASGPVSFMKVFDAATEQVKQGGRRRGANMAVLDATHPDVEAFVDVKATEDALRNFNLSVATDEAFWDAYHAGGEYERVNPRTGAVVESADARALLDRVAERAWECGDPGVLFRDTIEAANPTPALGQLEATNPCGEVPLLPYEACVLGSVNLGEHTVDGEMDWDALRDTVHLGVRFLDDALDASTFPVPEIATAVDRTRKVGLGVMGFHDALVDCDIPYDSDRAVSFADDLMAFVHDEAWAASRALADERGAFPAWEDSAFDEPVRNATTTTIAPTGSISLIAGCAASIEPIYGVAYTKHVLGGLEIVNDRFVETARERGFYDEALLEDLHGRSTLQDVDEIPDDVKALFRTAHDVPVDHHLRIQAAFQAHVDNAVSKTVNLPPDASVDDVRDAFRTAREYGCKGVTVFRAGATNDQVLGDAPRKEECAGECDLVAAGADGR
jgi:ribonucleoside-diphosphate reductase alpha chain